MRTFVINLPERKDRWEEVQREFEKMEIDPIRIEAIKASPGWVGCRDTHLKLLESVGRDEVFMICEDDVMFENNPRVVLDMAMDQLPKNWDMLYLGATLNQPLERYSDNLYRLKKGWTTHAIVYNGFFVVDYILEHGNEIRKIDVFYADHIQEVFNCFVVSPFIAFQRPGHSDVINKYTDYAAIRERYKLYMK